MPSLGSYICFSASDEIDKFSAKSSSAIYAHLIRLFDECSSYQLLYTIKFFSSYKAAA